MSESSRRGRAIAIAAVIVVVAAALIAYLATRGGGTDAPGAEPGRGRAPTAVVAPRPGTGSADPTAGPPSAGQGRAVVADVPAAGPGTVAGRVINWSTGAGVDGAELAFAGPGGAITVRSGGDGRFALSPPAGRYQLATVSAPGFLPYAPEWEHSAVEVEVVPARRVDGVEVFVVPAVDYTGTVLDRDGAPVAGAKVRLIASPAGEQILDRLPSEWTTDGKGTFTFHAPDDAVLEAERRGARGRARVDGDVAITHQLVIRLTGAPSADRVIDGRVVDPDGTPLPEVQVSAIPTADPVGGGRALAASDDAMRVAAFATTGADGSFVLRGLDADLYQVVAEVDDRAPAGPRDPVRGGTRSLVIVVAAGERIAGTVKTTAGDVVPAFTVLVWQRDGVNRDLIVARSIVDAGGRFAIRVPAGSYELVAAARGWAQSPRTPADAGATGVELVVSAGATIRGTVVSSKDASPVALARVMYESRGGGASVQPANAGTVTRDDGSFELTGLPPGPVSLTIAAGGFHPKIEGGFTATDGATLGPVTIGLTPLAGEAPRLELVGIGVQLTPDGDALRVDMLIPGGSAAEAGIVVGDRVSAVDGAPVIDLGLDGAVARIRGVEGSIVRITLARVPPVELAVPRRKLRS